MIESISTLAGPTKMPIMRNARIHPIYREVIAWHRC